MLATALHPARGRAWSGLFLRARFYWVWAAGVTLCGLGILWEPLMWGGIAVIALLLAATLAAFVQVGRYAKTLRAARYLDDRLSLGDDNEVRVRVDNAGGGRLGVTLLDELPIQFQERDFGLTFGLSPGAEREVTYDVRPLSRGVYEFGQLLLLVSTSWGLLQRRYAFGPEAQAVAVYPSVVQMKQQLLRVRQLLRRGGGNQRRRQLGRSYEFDQIKSYVAGDDYRLLNWKATARTGELMLNTYVEERSQQIVALVDTSRLMLSPFDGLSLLDYAVNSTLALLNVALVRGDRVGVVGFDRRVHTQVPAAARPEHLRRILEVLYRQESSDFEPDFEALYQYVRRGVRGRSLLMLYTNFETVVSVERNLPVLRQLSRAHLLVVVTFVNARINAEITTPPRTLEDAYLSTVAAEHDANQRRIATVLGRNGILVLRTTPQELTANAVTRYLAVKGGGRL